MFVDIDLNKIEVGMFIINIEKKGSLELVCHIDDENKIIKTFVLNDGIFLGRHVSSLKFFYKIFYD